MTVIPFDSASMTTGDPDSVTRLLQATARGDEAAFRELYDIMAGSVYGLIKRVLRDPAQSEEVAQDVLVEVWKLAARFDASKGSGRTWILMMAHRRAVDRVRSEQASTNRDFKVGVAQQERDHDSVSSDVEIRFEQRQVKLALEQLTETQRVALELAFYKGYTHTQVAEALDIPLGTAKTRLRDGLIHLRDAMGVSS